MPCGGIYPVNRAGPKWPPGCYLPGAQPNCFVCRKPWNPALERIYFCDEWDCWMHKECVHEFLQTEEGRCVLRHRHEIVIEEGG
jgi:hypothetical protein